MTTPTATAAEVLPERRPYQPYGSALELLRYKGPEVLLSGPAGTGKSRSCCEVMHLAAEKYPGMRGLIVRKTRESLTEAALVTFEEHVVPVGHPVLQGASRRLRQAYTYANGSTIVVGGIDKPGKIMSTEYDLIYVQEAIELHEADWESLTTRLRNGKIPHRQQIFADTNPDAPSHWLKRRCDSGRTKLIECRHEDNPVLFDHRAGDWTEAGRAYLAVLEALTGPRKLRLRHGRWVQAEGVVYGEWDAAVHLIDRFDIPAGWERFLVVDFGFTNPFVCQFWAIDPDGRLYRYREIYHTGRLVEDHAARIRNLLQREPPGVHPATVVCDHDAEGRATLEKHLGIGTTAARKEVRDGIQAVATRLRKAGDGKPRLFLMRDSLDERDPRLHERKLPCCTEEEMDGYIWDTRSSRGKGEEPLKANDHGVDACRYGVMYADYGAGPWRVGGSNPADSPMYRPPGGAFFTPKDDDGPIDPMAMRF